MDGFVALYIFLLAAFTGYVIASKTPSFLGAHLLTVSSFINGVVLVGAMIAMGHAETTMQTVIGFIAVALAAGNLMGGYMLTKRVLKVFSKDNASNISGEK